MRTQSGSQVPEKGLPEKLPEDEHILWQGRPDGWALTRDALNLNWVLGYFALLALWRAVSLTDQLTFAQGLLAALPIMLVGIGVAALLLLIGIIQARAATYTITNKRVVMRIGAALTLTLNLPYTEVLRADLQPHRSGRGTIALQLKRRTKISFLICWPHARPWTFRDPQPALRCIADAERVARILAEAAETQLSMPRVSRISDDGAQATTGASPVAAE
ncbi:MAG: photosynthetic complex putative assembly protein PuhB [Pseudomonadota bacterium]